MANSIPMDYTEDASKILEGYNDKPLTIFKCRMTNYTPFMPGDFDTATFHCQNNECYPTKPVLSQQLKGRMRWLARIVLADIPECSSMYDLNYRKIEEECVTVYLSKSALKMGLIQFMFGTVRSSSREKRNKNTNKSFASPFKIHIEVKERGNYKSLMWEHPNISEKVRSLFRSNKYWIQYADRYNTLLSRSKKIDKRSLAPIRPEGIEITVEILLEPFALNLDGTVYTKTSVSKGSNNLRVALPKIAAFYSALASTVLTVFGMGKGVNRGFGRFKPVSGFENCIPDDLLWNSASSNDYRSLLRTLLDSLGNLEKKQISSKSDAYKHIISALEELSRIAHEIIGQSPPEMGSLRRVPSLIGSAKGVQIPQSGRSTRLEGVSVVESCVNDIDDAIELIGACTLKHVLIQFRPRGSNQPSVEESVWVLGGPRPHYWWKQRRQSMFILFPLPNNKLIVILPLYADDKGLKHKWKQYLSSSLRVVYHALEDCLSNCNKGNKGGRQ